MEEFLCLLRLSIADDLLFFVFLLFIFYETVTFIGKDF